MSALHRSTLSRACVVAPTCRHPVVPAYFPPCFCPPLSRARALARSLSFSPVLLLPSPLFLSRSSLSLSRSACLQRPSFLSCRVLSPVGMPTGLVCSVEAMSCPAVPDRPTGQCVPPAPPAPRRVFMVAPIRSHTFISFNNISTMLRYLHEKPPIRPSCDLS